MGFFPSVSDALLTFAQACAGFVASETTEATTICDSEEGESPENGKSISP
jgi:hypothetical protein